MTDLETAMLGLPIVLGLVIALSRRTRRLGIALIVLGVVVAATAGLVEHYTRVRRDTADKPAHVTRFGSARE